MNKIKLWVDDIRFAPTDDWVVVRSITEAIRTLAQWDIEEVSLDHDISHQVAIGKVSRPYPCDECFCAVAYYIGEKYWIDRDMENEVIESADIPKELKGKIMRPLLGPKILVHTSNPVGAEKIKNILKDYGLTCTIKMSGLSNRLEMER